MVADNKVETGKGVICTCQISNVSIRSFVPGEIRKEPDPQLTKSEPKGRITSVCSFRSVGTCCA